MKSDECVYEVIVCTGKACRRSRGFGELLAFARTVRGAETIPCQSICKGPVVGVRRGKAIHWYLRVQRKRQNALEKVVRTGRGRKALQAAEVRRKRGRIRHPDERSKLV